MVEATVAGIGEMAAEIESDSLHEAAAVVQVEEPGLYGPGFEALLECNVVQAAKLGFAGDCMVAFG